MAVHPSFITPLKAEIIDLKGTCNAGHQKGDTFSISCYDSGGLLPATDMRWETDLLCRSCRHCLPPQ